MTTRSKPRPPRPALAASASFSAVRGARDWLDIRAASVRARDERLRAERDPNRRLPRPPVFFG
ncbi:hypothetical protein ACO0LV_09150 [Pseudactinotalea sp. Z1739]|uniref:hypothetical protein n=1 Tax=Pseudactinotalea sp. Z1739 TaxID=3413028 RepID=UPI003C7B5C8C